MHFSLTFFLFILCFNFFIFTLSEPISLNYISVLLPKRSRTLNHPVSLLLEGNSGGCYKWETNNPRVVELEQQPSTLCAPGSSKNVILRPAHSGNYDRESAWVWAEDVVTQHRAECEVFIDCITRLEILTSTRVINVGDTESLDIQAYDLAENVFTSVQGLPFHWSNTAENILGHVSLQEGLIFASIAQQELEEHGLGSDRVLMKGIRTGKVGINASLLENHCDKHSVLPASASFSVVEPLYLSPTYINTMPYCEIALQLHTRVRDQLTHHSHHTPIPMPSAHYNWTSSNTTVVKYERDYLVYVAMEIGHSQVIVTDVNLIQHHKESTIIVSSPFELRFKLFHQGKEVNRPCLDLYLVEGQSYSIEVEVIDNTGSIIDRCSLAQLNWTISEDFISFERMADSYIITLTALKEGIVSIGVTLDNINNPYVGVYNFSNQLSLTRRLIIISPIKAEPSQIILPLSPKKPHSFSLSISGGTGSFDTSSKNSNIVKVLSTSQILGKEEGNTIITFTDQCIPENYFEVLAIVSRPVELFFIEGPREMQMGTSLDIAVLVSDRQGRSYHNCSNLHLHTTLDPISKDVDSSISSCYVQCPIYNEQFPFFSCWILTITSNNTGFYNLKAYLDPQRVYAITTFLSFPPLEVRPDQIVMSVESEQCIQWIGGPLSWSPRDSVNHIIESSDDITMTFLENFNIFSLKCIHPHNQTIQLIFFNNATIKNPQPLPISINIEVFCYPRLQMYPHSVQLGVNTNLSLPLPSHPLKKKLEYRSIDPNIAYIDQYGHIFSQKLGITDIIIRIPSSAIPFNEQCSSTDEGLTDIVKVVVQFQGFVINLISSTLLKGESLCSNLEDINGLLPNDPNFQQVSVQWSADSPAVSLYSPFQIISEKNSDIVNGYTFCIRGEHKGRVTIFANIMVHYPLVEHFEQHVIVRVHEPLSILSSSYLLLPPNSNSQIRTTCEDSEEGLNYTVLSTFKSVSKNILIDSILPISINEKGLVQSSNRSGDSVVVITESSTRQYVSIIVSVRPITALRIIPPISQEYICIGKNFSVEVALYDSLGRRFNTAAISKYQQLIVSSSNTSVCSVNLLHITKKNIFEMINFQAKNIGESVVTINLVEDNTPLSSNIISPLFIKVNVVNNSFCIEPLAASISLYISPIYLFSSHRFEIESDCRDNIARTLNVPSKRISISSINLSTGQISFLILPFHQIPSMTLAEIFYKQIQDPESLLRKGTCFSHFNEAFDVHIDALSSLPSSSSLLWIEEKKTISNHSQISQPLTNFYSYFDFSSLHLFYLSIFSVIIASILMIFIIPSCFNTYSKPPLENPLSITGPGFYSDISRTSRFYEPDRTTSSVSFHTSM